MKANMEGNLSETWLRINLKESDFMFTKLLSVTGLVTDKWYICDNIYTAI